ncbi:MAG: trehalase-like domain-containing protein [Rhodomicrobium sp.]
MSNLDLGLIGNCAISALVDKQARIVWCCLPRFDGDPVFHQLLGSASCDPDDGAFTVGACGLQELRAVFVPDTRHYARR